MYWTVAQLVAHHTSNGCPLKPGDVFGSGMISAVDGTRFACTRGSGSLLKPVLANAATEFTQSRQAEDLMAPISPVGRTSLRVLKKAGVDIR